VGSTKDLSLNITADVIDMGSLATVPRFKSLNIVANVLKKGESLFTLLHFVFRSFHCTTTWEAGGADNKRIVSHEEMVVATRKEAL